MQLKRNAAAGSLPFNSIVRRLRLFRVRISLRYSFGVSIEKLSRVEWRVPGRQLYDKELVTFVRLVKRKTITTPTCRRLFCFCRVQKLTEDQKTSPLAIHVVLDPFPGWSKYALEVR